MVDKVTRFLRLLRTDDGVAERADMILTKYKLAEKEKGSSETDEPWKLPGQASQQPEQKPPPKRKRTYDDNKTA